jgi:histidyl-tRNA synthetase
MTSTFQALRGTRDILPGEVERWQLVERTTREVFERYGFREIRTPVIEATRLFHRTVGEATDIVRKEMYTLQAGDESITLRPENTAPVVRAFVEHSLHRTVAAGYPERYYYLGPMFRHERPQKGRQRQFHQLGAEVLGSPDPLVDAETLEMLWTFLDALEVQDRELRINSVGDAACRPAYREALREWLAPRLPSLCADCQRRYVENPLRVLDCKVEADRALLRDAPRPLDHLCSACAEHFRAVQGALAGYEIPHTVDRGIVRGLDYYQRTVFEVVSKGLGSQDSLLGGGRYDGLVEELGGPPVPGFGFALGIERLLLVLPESKGKPARPDLAIVALGEEGFRASIALARRLRKAGVSVLAPVAERPMGAQLKRAERAAARYALFVGETELREGKLGFKDLDTGEQVRVTEQEALDRARGRHGE